jgi:hypothetical protein
MTRYKKDERPTTVHLFYSMTTEARGMRTFSIS